MNKEKILLALTLAVKILSILAGGAAYMNYIPEKWMPVAVIVFGCSSAIKDCIRQVGDLLDDGLDNDSFK